VVAAASGIKADRIDEVLSMVELTDAARKRVKNYSLGMKQRLSLAAAILGNPEILVLDEPANGLDPAGIAWLRKFLRTMAAQGKTILVSSHQLAEMQNTVDDVLIINRGKLIASGDVKSVIGDGTLEEAFLRLTEGS
jgi:ABC-2 type transport system ATP-binding protein